MSTNRLARDIFLELEEPAPLFEVGETLYSSAIYPVLQVLYVYSKPSETENIYLVKTPDNSVMSRLPDFHAFRESQLLSMAYLRKGAIL